VKSLPQQNGPIYPTYLGQRLDQEMYYGKLDRLELQGILRIIYPSLCFILNVVLRQVQVAFQEERKYQALEWTAKLP
jgi:hypothetical protein